MHNEEREMTDDELLQSVYEQVKKENEMFNATKTKKDTSQKMGMERIHERDEKERMEQLKSLRDYNNMKNDQSMHM